jgi:hypothetical protein
LDDNGRLFGKISLIDIVILVIVAVLAVAAASKLAPTASGGTTATKPATYTVLIKNIKQSNADSMRAGDAIWSSAGTRIGTITDVAVNPARESGQLVDGTYRADAVVEGKVDVYLTIQTDVSTANGRIYVDRAFELGVNRLDIFKTKYTKFEGIIVSLNVAEDNNA